MQLCGPLQYNAAIQVFYSLQETRRLLAAVVKTCIAVVLHLCGSLYSACAGRVWNVRPTEWSCKKVSHQEFITNNCIRQWRLFKYFFTDTLSSKFAIRWSLNMPQHLKRFVMSSFEILMLDLNTNILQGSVATRLWCGEIFSDHSAKNHDLRAFL